MADPRLILCPRCGSFDIHGDHMTPLGQLHKCKACAYQGSFVIEADSPEDAKRIRRELQEDRQRAEDDEAGDDAG